LPSITDELIIRARHGTYHAYDVDNKFLWSVIRKMTQDGFAWNWVSNLARSRDGRTAYMQLKQHYLGPSFRSKIKSDADRILEDVFYDGKSRNFSLEDYCGKLKKAWADLEECGEVTPELKKMRTYLKNLTSPDLQAVKHAILANPTLETDVEAAMNYTSSIENSMKSLSGSGNRNISQLGTGGRRGGRRGGGKGPGNGNGKNRGKGKNPKTDFLPKEEWLKLKPEQQQAMREAREKAGISGGKRKIAEVSSEDTLVPQKKTIRILEQGEQQSNSKKKGVGEEMSRK
jgi:hypothetical protein